MNIMQKTIKHIALVNKHRWIVFKLSIKAGIPLRGLLHDLSKYSPTEFFESIQYYNGKRSPLHVAREKNGYSKSWLHHKGRNKHHLEYWEDISKNGRIGVFPPYKYIVEAICDKIAAGMVYQGKEWTKEEPYEYWSKLESKAPVEKHPATMEFMNTVLKKVAEVGVDETLKPSYLRKTYNEVSEKFCK